MTRSVCIWCPALNFSAVPCIWARTLYPIEWLRIMCFPKCRMAPSISIPSPKKCLEVICTFSLQPAIGRRGILKDELRTVTIQLCNAENPFCFAERLIGWKKSPTWSTQPRRVSILETGGCHLRSRTALSSRPAADLSGQQKYSFTIEVVEVSKFGFACEDVALRWGVPERSSTRRTLVWTETQKDQLCRRHTLELKIEYWKQHLWLYGQRCALQSDCALSWEPLLEEQQQKW